MEQAFGDPEIPNHGFIRQTVEVNVTEGGLRCEHKSLNLENGELQLCSGRSIFISNFADQLEVKRFESGPRISASSESLRLMKLHAKVTSAECPDCKGQQLELTCKYTQDGVHEGNRDD
jgi:hypothetical protein